MNACSSFRAKVALRRGGPQGTGAVLWCRPVVPEGNTGRWRSSGRRRCDEGRETGVPYRGRGLQKGGSADLPGQCGWVLQEQQVSAGQHRDADVLSGWQPEDVPGGCGHVLVADHHRRRRVRVADAGRERVVGEQGSQRSAVGRVGVLETAAGDRRRQAGASRGAACCRAGRSRHMAPQMTLAAGAPATVRRASHDRRENRSAASPAFAYAGGRTRTRRSTRGSCAATATATAQPYECPTSTTSRRCRWSSSRLTAATCSGRAKLVPRWQDRPCPSRSGTTTDRAARDVPSVGGGVRACASGPKTAPVAPRPCSSRTLGPGPPGAAPLRRW